MNSCFPDWNIEAELPVPHQKKPFGLDHELVELLWENGQVVLHSQTHRKSASSDHDLRQQVNHKHDDQSNIHQENETVSWIHDDPFEKEFSSNFLPEIPLPNHPVESHKQIQQLNDSFGPNPILDPIRFQTFNSPHKSNNNNNNNIGCCVGKCPHVPSPMKPDLVGSSKGQNKNLMIGGGGEVREYSMRTVGSSHCGSNQVAMDATDYTSRASSCGIGNTNGLSAAMMNDYGGNFGSQNEIGERETTTTTHELATASSSGGSGTSIGRTCTGTDSLKRKSRDAEDSECQSDAFLDSAARKKPASKSGTARKSRAAEVHNLSERRRRDRINEKMRALQELLPHSNKSDKASMLDEAIEYMKSLQLQLQMMWMGSGMAPMMFPGVQHYMSRLGMRIGPPTLPPLPNPMHLSRLPMVDHQAMNVAAPAPNQAAIYQNQLQNSNFPHEQYASYMGLIHPMQNNSQPMNIFGFGPNIAQQNHSFGPPNNTNGSSAG